MLAGRKEKWWFSLIPFWCWDFYWTWDTGRRVINQTERDNVSLSIYTDLMMHLQKLNEDGKIELSDLIREKLGLPDMRKLPKYLPYMGDD